MKKSRFVDIIRHIEEHIEKDHQLSKLLMDKSTYGWVTTAGDIVQDLVNTLSLLFREENLDDSWISWYLWDVDDDKENAHLWTEFDGEYYKFRIADAEDLYYLLTHDYGNIKEKEIADREEVTRGLNKFIPVDFNDVMEDVEGWDA